MTESSLLHTTHTVPHADPIPRPHAATPHPPPKPVAHAGSANDEEDYIIKCICHFSDDDGNTVQCDRCATWQHIICYFPNKPPGESDAHSCVDCDKRLLDGAAATERQKTRREHVDPGDRKAKKSAPKSHKKKVKALDQQSNGWSDQASPRTNGTNGHAREYSLSSKKVKSSHRASHSVHALQPSLKVSTHPAKRSVSASHSLQSPSKASSNHFAREANPDPFSDAFLHLYDDDPGERQMHANLFNDIKITASLSEWSNDVEAVKRAANGKSPHEIYYRCDQPLDSMKLPALQKRTKLVEKDGIRAKSMYLTLDSFTPQGAIVGELRGKIGHMHDYTKEEANHWNYLRHPLPFVFFHPRLPIYIDTREEGNMCRYLRRSCKPNLKMNTILEDHSGFHFCFVATRDLEEGAELTIPWTFDEHVRRLLQPLDLEDGMTESERDEEVREKSDYLTNCVERVLGDFGECACNSGVECTLSWWDARPSNSPLDASDNEQGKLGKLRRAAGRRRKAIQGKDSPGDGTSRSGSEALKYFDDDRDESRSTTNSSRSKPNSRDITPSNNSKIDKPALAGLEISGREKRKIERLLEQDKHQSVQKKKKRTSAGSALNTPTEMKQLKTPVPTSHSATNTPTTASRPRYVDTGTSRMQSGSPVTKTASGQSPSLPRISSHLNSPTVPSPLRRQNYVDSAAQTDPDPEPAPLRRPFMTFEQHILKMCLEERDMLDAHVEAQKQAATAYPIAAGAAMVEDNYSAGITVKPDPDGDVPMNDAVLQSSSPRSLHAVGPTLSTSPPLSNIKPPPPVWSPPQALDAPQSGPVNGFRSNSLRLDLPPNNGIPGMSTPTLNTPNISIAQSPLQTPSAYPFNSIVQPSPVKKKLSLGDYMKSRRGSSQQVKAESSAGTEPAGLSKPLAAVVEAGKDSGPEAGALIDTPKAENSSPTLPELGHVPAVSTVPEADKKDTEGAIGAESAASQS